MAERRDPTGRYGKRHYRGLYAMEERTREDGSKVLHPIRGPYRHNKTKKQDNGEGEENDAEQSTSARSEGGTIQSNDGLPSGDSVGQQQESAAVGSTQRSEQGHEREDSGSGYHSDDGPGQAKRSLSREYRTFTRHNQFQSYVGRHNIDVPDDEWEDMTLDEKTNWLDNNV
jgi:hypothetical protein